MEVEETAAVETAPEVSPRLCNDREQERCSCLPFWCGEEMPLTPSMEAQWETEKVCQELYKDFDGHSGQMYTSIVLRKKNLAKFLLRGFERLPAAYTTLDASHPWLCFWILHGVRVLGEPIPAPVQAQSIKILRACQSSTGGFGGGPGQIPHLASTYAACMALASVETDEALSVIDRDGIRAFIQRMRQPSGAFTMNEDGEEDTRAAYCAVAVAVLLDISYEALFEFTADWLSECQTYDGGFGALPGAEAHGGYTFCAFTALYLLDKPFVCDLDQLARWMAFRQMRYEGGFQGRTNKLVDSCYSFWQGAVFPLLQQVLQSRPGYEPVHVDSWFFDRVALQEYVIICCQTPDGGICDKPDKNSDYYHTCYALAGISVAQHTFTPRFDCILGPEANRLEEIHPAFNLTTSAVLTARHFFKSRILSS